jgi:hypothetical protein
MHPALRCSDTFATCGPSSMQASGRRALRAPGRGWAYKGSTHPATMALALGGLLGLLAFMLCPTEAVVGKHNCPLDCNGHGLCSMTEEMKCTCYAGWTESALCDKRKWLTILIYTFHPLASQLRTSTGCTTTLRAQCSHVNSLHASEMRQLASFLCRRVLPPRPSMVRRASCRWICPRPGRVLKQGAGNVGCKPLSSQGKRGKLTGTRKRK